MKRSEINQSIVDAKTLLSQIGFALPQFAYWSDDEWVDHADEIDTICKTMLGWDITDFGTGDFEHIGAVLFTLRNGEQKEGGKGTPYAEKIIYLKEGQRLPLHFHFTKTEDIINRGGGRMVIKLYNAKPNNAVDYETDVVVFMDGIAKKVHAGEELIIEKGNSITLTPRMYHLFGAVQGAGDLVAGEVSSVNDDNTDNYFAEQVSRFVAIHEDEKPIHPLCNEYAAALKK